MSAVTLFHAAPSYYSMIARLTLALGDITYESRQMDIHRGMDQLSPGYGLINPHLTVPALKTDSLTLADSRDILAWAVRERPGIFGNGGVKDQAILDAHYAISIEGLTFGRTMLRFPPLRLFFPRLLAKVCRDLRARQAAYPALAGVYEKKIQQNEARIRFFKEGSLVEKVEDLRQQAHRFIRMIPVPAGIYLWGDHPSQSDVVLAVFIARLMMIGEVKVLAERPDLVLWFDRMKKTPAYQASDIWTRFSLRRILFRR